jgi:hypothetical protein
MCRPGRWWGDGVELVRALALGSVERMFSRMKEQRSLNRLRQRGLAKVSTHVYLSALSMVATGLAQGVNGEPLQYAA